MAAHASGVFLDVETQAAASQDAGQRRLRMAWFFQGMGLAALMLIGVAAMGGLPSGSEKPSGHDAAVAGWVGGALPTTRTGGKAAMSQAQSTWSSRSSRHGLRFASPIVMAQDDVEDKVKGIIAEQLGVEASSVKPDSSFTDDLGADSLDAVELIMAIEEAFDIEIPDEEAETMTTPADCVTAIKSKI